MLAPLGNRAPGGFNRRAGVFVGGFPGSILIEGEFLRELLLELRDEVRAVSLCVFLARPSPRAVVLQQRVAVAAVDCGFRAVRRIRRCI